MIDVALIVSSAEVGRAIVSLRRLGSEHEGGRGVPRREAMRAPVASIPHDLYICREDGEALANHRAIRNHLRDDAEAARHYGRLKVALALEHPDDIAAYVEGKTAFLPDVLQRSGFSATSLDEIARMNRRPNERANG